MQRRSAFVFLALFMGLGAACGGTPKKHYIPVDSPLAPFEAPDRDDLVDEDEDDKPSPKAPEKKAD